MEAAIQEDADAVGLSVLSGAHLTLSGGSSSCCAERGAADIVVFGGGIIPDDDIPELERLGVAKVFTPGATTRVHRGLGPDATSPTARPPGGRGGGLVRNPATDDE